ncbi:MAG: ATP-binding cassette domain-containing protein [Pseudomonadota bacterium]
MTGLFHRNALAAAFWPLGWMLGLAFLFSFFVTLLMLTSPMFMLLLYDRVLPARSEETLVALFALVVLFFILMAMLDYARRRLLARAGARLQMSLERMVLAVSEAERSPGKSTNTSPVSGTKELDGLRGFLHSNALVDVLDCCLVPVFLGAVFLLHPLLGWVAVTGILVLAALSGLKAVFCGHLGDDASKASSAMGREARRLQETLETVREQRMAGRFTARWLSARAASRDMAIILNDQRTIFTCASMHFRGLFQAGILALGAALALENTISIGAMVAAFILLVRVFWPVEQCLKHIPVIQSAWRNWQSLNTKLKSPPAVPALAETQTLAPRLSVKGLSIADHERACVLRDVSFVVNAGEIVEITGATGAGKSLLARALIGLYPRQSGSVRIGACDIRQIGCEALGTLIGYLPEDPVFVPATIAENISGFRPDADRSDVIAAAKLAGVHDRIEALPKGYDTALKARGTGLSRGERTQIALARAVFGVPKALVLEEPGALAAALPGALPDTAVLVLGRTPELSGRARQYRLGDGALVDTAQPFATSPKPVSAKQLMGGVA